jgi:hypoxanthine phosphoribosyltransferase
MYASYQERKGVWPISWQDFHGICKGLALAVAKYDPEAILGVARGGLYPATLLSHLLQKELYPIRLTRRVNDMPVRDHPIWITKPPSAIEGLRVLVVDEISGAGETLSIVKAEALRLGAKEVRSAVMYAHEAGKDVPDYIGLITDALLLNPWDREVLRDGKFVFHPEYVGALGYQGLSPDDALLPGIEAIKLAKMV